MPRRFWKKTCPRWRKALHVSKDCLPYLVGKLCRSESKALSVHNCPWRKPHLSSMKISCFTCLEGKPACPCLSWKKALTVPGKLTYRYLVGKLYMFRRKAWPVHTCGVEDSFTCPGGKPLQAAGALFSWPSGRSPWRRRRGRTSLSRTWSSCTE